VSSIGRAARAQAAIKVRQPIAEALVAGLSPSDQAGLQNLADSIIEELNVKRLGFVADVSTLPADAYSLIAEGPVTVAIDKRLSKELADEGLVREITHRLQGLRRTANFEIADNITTFYETDDYTNHVVTNWADYIKKETLSKEMVKGIPGDAAAEMFKLEGHEVKLAVKKT